MRSQPALLILWHGIGCWRIAPILPASVHDEVYRKINLSKWKSNAVGSVTFLCFESRSAPVWQRGHPKSEWQKWYYFTLAQYYGRKGRSDSEYGTYILFCHKIRYMSLCMVVNLLARDTTLNDCRCYEHSCLIEDAWEQCLRSEDIRFRRPCPTGVALKTMDEDNV